MKRRERRERRDAEQLNALSEAIIGAAIKVHSELGPGLLESAYESCLLFELRRRGLFAERQKPQPVPYDGLLIDCGYRMDLLVQELRWRLRRTSLRRAQAVTLRERLFKMAARVEESVRRFVFHCPVDFPWAPEWMRAAVAVGAAPG